MPAFKDDDQDPTLFRKRIGKVRRVKQNRTQPYRPGRKPVPEQTQREHQEVMDSLLSDDYEPSEVETGEELLFVRPGIQHRVMRKLRRGEYTIEAELDLHGQRVPAAREMVGEFLRECLKNRHRCVRIIHGKGLSSDGKLPVLKGKVNSWLQQRNEVLAFCSAPRRDGGTGAVYVLLKRK